MNSSQISFTFLGRVGLGRFVLGRGGDMVTRRLLVVMVTVQHLTVSEQLHHQRLQLTKLVLQTRTLDSANTRRSGNVVLEN